MSYVDLSGELGSIYLVGRVDHEIVDVKLENE